MNTVIISDIEYIVLGYEFFNKAPVFCKNSRNARDLIKKNKITDFIFAREINNIWTITNGKAYKYDKVLLKKSFADTIPEFNRVDKDYVNNVNIGESIGLVSTVLGVNAKIIKDVLNTDTHTFLYAV